MSDEGTPAVTVEVENGEAADEARASAAAAAQAAAAAIADAGHVAAQAQAGAAAQVEEIAENTLEELNESERRLSQWLQENQASNLTLHQETRQEIQTLKTETGAAIASILALLEKLQSTPPPQEGTQSQAISPGEQTRMAAPQGNGDANPDNKTGRKSERRRHRI